jgi:hypothetical protein
MSRLIFFTLQENGRLCRIRMIMKKAINVKELKIIGEHLRVV